MKQTRFNFGRITGASLILMAILAGYGYGYGFTGLFVEGNPAESYARYLAMPKLIEHVANAFLFILGLDVLVSFTLYHWMKVGQKQLVLAMSGLRLLYSAMLALAIYPLYAVQCSGESIGETALYEALAQFNHGFSVGLVVFGLHLFLLGLAMLKHVEIPKVLGYLALFAGICYTLMHSVYLLAPEFKSALATVEAILALPMAAGELVLAFWLLIKGKRLG